MVNLEHVSLADLIPNSIANDAQVQAAVVGIDPELRLVGGAAGEALLLSRIGELPEGVIDLLAWQYHCDFYSDALSLEQKRNLVRDSILWHRKKGTKWAVIKVLENLGIKAEIKEWFETGSAPYTFTVAVTFPGDPDKTYSFMDSEAEQIIRDAINEAKPVHADIFSLVAKDENRDPDHICFWDVCNFEHGAFGILTEGPDCEVERSDPGEILHVGVQKEYSDAVAILRYLAFDIARWDDKPPDTGAALTFEVRQYIECEHTGGEVSVSFRSYPITMAVFDDAVHDGLPVIEPTLVTGGWSGKFDSGARFDDMDYKPRERRMVTGFVSESPTIEIPLREMGLNPTVEGIAVQQRQIIEVNGNERENEISVLQLWEVQDTWRTRKVWSMRSWRNNINSPEVIENTFQSEVLDVARARVLFMAVEREPLELFDRATFDGTPQERLPNCVTITQIPRYILDPQAITIEVERQSHHRFDDSIFDGEPQEFLPGCVTVNQIPESTIAPNATTITVNRESHGEIIDIKLLRKMLVKVDRQLVQSLDEAIFDGEFSHEFLPNCVMVTKIPKGVIPDMTVIEVERQPMHRFDEAIFDGEPQEFLPGCVTVNQIPESTIDSNATTITVNRESHGEILDVKLLREMLVKVDRQPVQSLDEAILDGEPQEFLPDCVTITQRAKYVFEPDAITIEIERQPVARFDETSFDNELPREFLPDGVTINQEPA